MFSRNISINLIFCSDCDSTENENDVHSSDNRDVKEVKTKFAIPTEIKPHNTIKEILWNTTFIKRFW